MRNHVNVSIFDKVSNLSGIVKDVAPFVMDKVYHDMKNKHDDIWHKYCFDKDETACQFVYNLITAKMAYYLSDNVINEILERYDLSITNMEITQLYNLDPMEEMEQWEFWEKQDKQADLDDFYNMYLNEY